MRMQMSAPMPCRLLPPCCNADADAAPVVLPCADADAGSDRDHGVVAREQADTDYVPDAAFGTSSWDADAALRRSTMTVHCFDPAA